MCCSASSTTFRNTSKQVHHVLQVVVTVGEHHSGPDRRRVSATEVNAWVAFRKSNGETELS